MQQYPNLQTFLIAVAILISLSIGTVVISFSNYIGKVLAIRLMFKNKNKEDQQYGQQ